MLATVSHASNLPHRPGRAYMIYNWRPGCGRTGGATDTLTTIIRAPGGPGAPDVEV